MQFFAIKSGTGQTSICSLDFRLLPIEAAGFMRQCLPPAEIAGKIPNPGYTFGRGGGPNYTMGDDPIAPETVLEIALKQRETLGCTQLHSIRDGECLIWFLRLYLDGKWNEKHARAYSAARALMSTQHGWDKNLGEYVGWTTWEELQAETERLLAL